ncbi:uncharacterized protein TNCV_3628631 [Trichonephila clavipes]|nr:uncharacterized protein TNCV_3628631 [Trichonephila clavipes]
MPQQKVQGVLWLMEFKSLTRLQRRVRTDPAKSKSIHQWERTLLKKTGTLVPKTGKYPSVFVIEDSVDRVRDSFCRSPDKSIKQTSSDIPFR